MTCLLHTQKYYAAALSNGHVPQNALYYWFEEQRGVKRGIAGCPSQLQSTAPLQQHSLVCLGASVQNGVLHSPAWVPCAEQQPWCPPSDWWSLIYSHKDLRGMSHGWITSNFCSTDFNSWTFELHGYMILASYSSSVPGQQQLCFNNIWTFSATDIYDYFWFTNS